MLFFVQFFEHFLRVYQRHTCTPVSWFYWFCKGKEGKTNYRKKTIQSLNEMLPASQRAHPGAWLITWRGHSRHDVAHRGCRWQDDDLPDPVQVPHSLATEVSASNPPKNSLTVRCIFDTAHHLTGSGDRGSSRTRIPSSTCRRGRDAQLILERVKQTWRSAL